MRCIYKLYIYIFLALTNLFILLVVLTVLYRETKEIHIYYIHSKLRVFFWGDASEKSPSCWLACVCHDSHGIASSPGHQVTVSLDPPSRWSGRLLATQRHTVVRYQKATCFFFFINLRKTEQIGEKKHIFSVKYDHSLVSHSNSGTSSVLKEQLWLPQPSCFGHASSMARINAT